MHTNRLYGGPWSDRFCVPSPYEIIGRRNSAKPCSAEAAAVSVSSLMWEHRVPICGVTLAPHCVSWLFFFIFIVQGCKTKFRWNVPFGKAVTSCCSGSVEGWPPGQQLKRGANGSWHLQRALCLLEMGTKSLFGFMWHKLKNFLNCKLMPVPLLRAVIHWCLRWSFVSFCKIHLYFSLFPVPGLGSWRFLTFNLLVTSILSRNNFSTSNYLKWAIMSLNTLRNFSSNPKTSHYVVF